MGSLKHGMDPFGDPQSLWSRGVAACPAGQPGGLLLALCLPTRGTGLSGYQDMPGTVPAR